MDGKGAVKAMEEGGAKLNGINALLYGACLLYTSRCV